jgi:hypothetical protein
MTAPIASGWSGCRMDTHPLRNSALARRTPIPVLRSWLIYKQWLNENERPTRKATGLARFITVIRRKEAGLAIVVMSHDILGIPGRLRRPGRGMVWLPER